MVCARCARESRVSPFFQQEWPQCGWPILLLGSQEADSEDVKGAIDLGNVKEVACKGTSGEFVIEMKPEAAGAKTSDTLLKAADLAEA